MFCQDLEIQLAMKDREKAVNNLWHARGLLAVGRCCVSVWNSSTRLPINTLVNLVLIHYLPAGSATNNKPATKMGITKPCGFSLLNLLPC